MDAFAEGLQVLGVLRMIRMYPDFLVTLSIHWDAETPSARIVSHAVVLLGSFFLSETEGSHCSKVQCGRVLSKTHWGTGMGELSDFLDECESKLNYFCLYFRIGTHDHWLSLIEVSHCLSIEGKTGCSVEDVLIFLTETDRKPPLAFAEHHISTLLDTQVCYC